MEKARNKKRRRRKRNGVESHKGLIKDVLLGGCSRDGCSVPPLDRQAKPLSEERKGPGVAGNHGQPRTNIFAKLPRRGAPRAQGLYGNRRKQNVTRLQQPGILSALELFGPRRGRACGSSKISRVGGG